MGDLASKKSSSQTSTIANHQVTQSGRGQIGISGSSLYNSDITVIDADAATAEAAIDVTNRALEAMAIGLNGAALIAAGGQRTAEKAVDAVANVSGRAIDANTTVARDSVSLAAQTVTQSLKMLQVSQARALDTVDDAVSVAQETALRATPIPPTNLSESITRQVLIASVVGLVAIIVWKK
jgi:hypothetical protein